MNRIEKFERFASTAEARKDVKRSSIRAFTAVLASSGGEFALRVGSTAILARLIAPEHFGLFMMITAVTAIADQFRDLGLSTATIQREKIGYQEVSNLFWINATAGLALTCFVCALAPFIAAYYQEPRLTFMTLVLSVNFIFGGLTVQHEALMTRQMKHGQKALVRLFASLLSSILAVAMAAYGFSYWALVWREVARSVLIFIAVWLVCPWIPGLPDRKTNVRSLLGFGRDLSATYILGVLSSSVDRLLIGKFFGPGPVAHYRQPYQLVVAPMNQFMSPLYLVALPGLSMLQDDPPRYRRYYYKVITIVAMLSMPLSLFLAVYSREITLIVLGEQWIQSVIFFKIFAFGGILRSVVSTTGFVLVSRGNSSRLLKVGIVNSSLMVVLMCVGVRWGAEGVAVAEVATVILMMAPLMHFCFSGSPVTIGGFLSSLTRPAVSCLLMGIALVTFQWVFPLASNYASIFSGALVAGLVLSVSWMFLPGGRTEIQSLLSDTLSSLRRKAVPVASN